MTAPFSTPLSGLTRPFLSERTTALQRCSRCKQVSYCGATCQKKAWKDYHKAECGADGLLCVLAGLNLAPDARDEVVLLGRTLRRGCKERGKEAGEQMLALLEDGQVLDPTCVDCAAGAWDGYTADTTSSGVFGHVAAMQ